GVKEVLTLVNEPDAGPWRTVVGLVADLLTVGREHAPLIDIALGEQAQYILVRNGESLTAALAVQTLPFSGRVTFCPAPAAPPWLSANAAGLPRHPGLVGPAAQLATCSHPDFGHLPEQLLGATLIVKDLAAARDIARTASGFRFVTLQGELLEADGVLT